MALKSHTELIQVEAAGGYVLRRSGQETEVLMIFRRGVWDLPKGKPDPDETPAQCALREVAEETGARDLAIIRGAGMTLHTYEEEDYTVLKTTWWFLMQTGTADLAPQAEEQIERVEWVPWHQAREMVGYENLRRHMNAIDRLVRDFDVEDP